MMKKTYISDNAYPETIRYLKDCGYEVNIVTKSVGSPIGSHADLYHCRLLPLVGSFNFTKTFCNSASSTEKGYEYWCDDSKHNSAVSIDKTLLPLQDPFCNQQSSLFHGNRENVGFKYPNDCIYNAASTGKFFIHNTKITDPDLLAAAKQAGLILINVKQGYAKCNCVIVDENSIITSDAGIASACRKYNETSGADSLKIDVLLISSGHVELPGFKYGFLGGASGLILDQNGVPEIVFNGDISVHSDYLRIKDFIEDRGVRIKHFPERPLMDIGSIV